MLLLLATKGLWAQQDSTQTATPISNWKELSVAVLQDTLVLDSLSVFPNSLMLRNAKGIIPDSTYTIEGNLLIFSTRPNPADIEARFRVFPFSITEKREHKDVSAIGKSIQHDGLIGSGYTYNPF